MSALSSQHDQWRKRSGELMQSYCTDSESRASSIPSPSVSSRRLSQSSRSLASRHLRRTYASCLPCSHCQSFKLQELLLDMREVRLKVKQVSRIQGAETAECCCLREKAHLGGYPWVAHDKSIVWILGAIGHGCCWQKWGVCGRCWLLYDNAGICGGTEEIRHDQECWWWRQWYARCCR